jgi:hypothetical protein
MANYAHSAQWEASWQSYRLRLRRLRGRSAVQVGRTLWKGAIDTIRPTLRPMCGLYASGTQHNRNHSSRNLRCVNGQWRRGRACHLLGEPVVVFRTSGSMREEHRDTARPTPSGAQPPIRDTTPLSGLRRAEFQDAWTILCEKSHSFALAGQLLGYCPTAIGGRSH